VTTQGVWGSAARGERGCCPEAIMHTERIAPDIFKYRPGIIPTPRATKLRAMQMDKPAVYFFLSLERGSSIANAPRIIVDIKQRLGAKADHGNSHFALRDGPPHQNKSHGRARHVPVR
jgi:hypothetical protein